jgi:hypothetical protein
MIDAEDVEGLRLEGFMKRLMEATKKQKQAIAKP